MTPADRAEVERIELRMIALVKFLLWCFSIPAVGMSILLVGHIYLDGIRISALEAQVKELKEGKG